MGDRELRVKFLRLPEAVSVLGNSLDAARAQELAKRACASPEETKEWNEVLEDPTPALWVAVRPGDQVPVQPILPDIAQLIDAGSEAWGHFVARHGLLEFGREWLVAWLGEENILRIPLSTLNETAYKAAVLMAARKATLGFPRELEEWGPFAVTAFASVIEQRSPRRSACWQIKIGPLRAVDKSTSYGYAKRVVEEGELADPAAEARKIIALALEDALDQVGAKVEPGDRGIPETWAFYARGCWPLVVLEEFVHKDRHVRYTSTFCAACSKPLPKGRSKFCCNTCRERAKKQRQRAKRGATTSESAESSRV